MKQIEYKHWLNEGEIFCDKCNGTGYKKDAILSNLNFDIYCNKCLGEGKLDWIENIVGKKSNSNTVFVSPGVYTKEVDLTMRVPIHKIDIDPIIIFNHHSIEDEIYLSSCKTREGLETMNELYGEFSNGENK